MPDIGYLVFRESTPDWHIKDKQGIFNAWDMTYFIEGAACYTIDGKPYELAAGDLLCLPPHQKREAHTYPDRLMHCYAANFKLKGLSGAEQPVIPLPLVSHIGIREDIIQLFNELLITWMYPQPMHLFKARALFMLILHRFMETALFNINTSVSDSRVQKALRHISSHYSEKITVKKMAQLCNLNEVYFGNLFKRETGMTLLQCLMVTRIRYAENFLRSGKFRVNEAAEQCGFSDIFHFYKHFKEIVGVAPSSCIPKKIKR